MPIPRVTMRETTRQICLRAAKQQTGASPVTAVTIGSGNYEKDSTVKYYRFSRSCNVNQSKERQ